MPWPGPHERSYVDGMTLLAPPLSGVAAARAEAWRLLAELPERWSHTVGVARRAERLCAAVGEAEREVVVAAAWLHDVGYAEPLRDTGFHPLDGARHLDRRDWPARIAALVAHHSGACFVARARGLEPELAWYEREESGVADLLTYADQTVGPGGVRMDVHTRIADMLRRHGPGSANALVHHLRGPHLLAVAGRVERRLAAAPA